MLVKSNVVSTAYEEQLREVGKLMCEYIKYVANKHIAEEGTLTYSWDGYRKDEGQFSLSLIKAFGLHVTQVVGGNDVASVMFMTSGGLGELFEKLKFSRLLILNVYNTTGDPWVSIDADNINAVAKRSIVATRADNVDIDVEYFKNELAALRFIGDLY